MPVDEELGTGSITITLDDSTADTDADRLGSRIERALDRASRSAGLRLERNIRAAVRRITPVQIQVEPDLDLFRNTVNNLGSTPLTVTPDVDRGRFEAAIAATLADLEVSVRVVADLDGFDAAVRAHRPPAVTVDVNADTDRFGAALGRLGSIAGRTGGALTGLLRLGAVAVAAAAAAQTVAGLTASLAPAAGLLAAGPAVILGYQSALGTLKLALSGVSDAFSAALTGSAAEFSKSLESLSPAAQAAAREVSALKPAFEELRASVQDAFFQQFEGDITRTASALRGQLLSSLTAISAAWGNAAKSVLGYVQSARGVSNVKAVLDATRLGAEGLASTTGRLTAGFLSVGAAVSDAFGARFGAALGNAGQSFGTFLQNAADSGQAVDWVEGAVTALKQLGTILSNVGSVLSGVFQAGSNVGAGFLSNLEAITRSFSEFVNSARGQEAIGAVFATIGSIAAQLGPILAALVTQIGAIAPALAPVFEALGPALVGLISSLGPALAAIAPSLQSVASALAGAFAAIGPALGPLGEAIGNVLTALAPLLPVIGQLVAAVATGLAPVLSALAAALTPVISALSAALAQVLPPLTEAFTTLASALTPLITLIGTALAQVITALAPLLASLAVVFTQIVAAIAPLIEQLVSALMPVLPPVIAAFAAVLSALLPIAAAFAQVIAALAPLVSLVITALAPVIQFSAAVAAWLTLSTVVPVIQAIAAVLTSLAGVLTRVVGLVVSFVQNVIAQFQRLYNVLVGNSIIPDLINAVIRLFTTLPGKILGALGSLVSSIAGVFTRAASAALAAVSRFVATAVGILRSLPAKARAALGGASSALVSAGRDLIQGMINGIRSMAGAIASVAKSVVQGAVDGAKSLLGISSPSKVFREIGMFVGQGFVKGLQGTENDIKQAAEQVIGKIRDAFRGQNTRLDDRLIESVQGTTKRLTKLAADRDALAAKIQKANDLAVSVTQAALSAFSLSNLAREGGGIKGLTDGIESAINRITKFNTQVNALAKRGLREDLLSQIRGLGPEQGAALASTLSSATGRQLKDLNEAQRQLAAASKKLGRDSADNLFDAGKQASKGFLEGLKAQQKDVEDLMLTLARAMARAIRNALGIKSPSTVFREIGRFTMDGLSGGVEDRLRAVRRSVLGAASAITDPFGGTPSLGAIGVSGARQAGVRGNRQVVNNWTINEVGDAEATAQRVLNRMALAGGNL